MVRKNAATLRPDGRVQADVPRIRKQLGAERHHIGILVARGEGRIADVALDQIGLARALLELPRLLQKLVSRRGQHRLAAAHQPGLREQSGVDVKQAAMRVPRKAVRMAVDGHARARRVGEVRLANASLPQVIVDRLDQPLGGIIGDDTLMHRHEVGRIARRHLRGQLRISRPGDDIDVDMQVGIFRVEAVDHRGDDSALALGLGDVDAAAIFGAALAEETLQIDVRLAVAPCAAAERQGKQQRCNHALHRTAVPAMARTICFWKMM